MKPQRKNKKKNEHKILKPQRKKKRKNKKKTRTITAECTENQKEKKFVFFQLFAKKGHPPTGEKKSDTFGT